MTDNVTNLDAYRRRLHPATDRNYVVREQRDNVALAVLSPVTELTPEEARKLGEELIDTANLIEDRRG